MSKNDLKILIAEDDQPILDLYDKKFSANGFEVIRAVDGGEAYEKATTQNPDAIILDIMMPVMNGFEVLKKLKKNKDTAEIPVVILSNYGEMPNITEGLMGGAVEYLIKVEHTPDEVLDVVTDAVKERSSLIGKAFKETA
jgi:two-component system, OmpR family, alkaline phosphatase synthesis response regulator PhoP